MVRQIERRLRGEALLPFRYRDFGSLVSLGRHTTVGNLMGFLFGRGVFIELTTADQRLVTRKNRKVRRMRELYPEVPISIVYQRDFASLIASHGLLPGAA